MAKKGNSNGSCECKCLHNSVLVESLVITLTIVGCLAITGHTLISLDFILVPKSFTVDHEHNRSFPATQTPQTPNNQSGTNLQSDGQSAETESNSTPLVTQSPDRSSQSLVQEDEHVMDILEHVFCYTSLAIAGIFLVEILFKMLTLRKLWFNNPWQVFDAFVVVGYAAVQITFYFVSVSVAIYCASFVVILRLWRIPLVCKMTANQAREELEQDIELYRSGKRSAEERCIRLENDLARKKEEIRKLEDRLQDVTFKTQNEVNTNDSCQPDLTPVLRQGNFSSKNNSLQGNSVLKNEVSSKEVKDLRLKTPLKRTKNVTDVDIDSDVDPLHHNNIFNEKRLTDRQSNQLKEKYTAIGIFSGTLPRSEALYNIKSLTDYHARPASILNIPRRRRSSTGDFMDYSSISSPERQVSIQSQVFKDMSPSYSCPTLDICEEDSNTKLVSEDEQPLDIVDGRQRHSKRLSDTSGTPSNESSSSSSAVGSSIVSDEPSSPKKHKPVKRFSSCPEYVFTQRMSITTDESLLIEEKHTWFEPQTYENSAFLDEDDVPLQVLAEIDGTKTYRSETGIPMTSL